MALRLMPSQLSKRSIAMLTGQPTWRRSECISRVPSAKVEALASNPEYTRIGYTFSWRASLETTVEIPLWLTKEGHFFLASHAPGTYESIDMYGHRDKKHVVGCVHFGAKSFGHPGVVHGGCIATVYDEFFVTAMLWALDSAGVTASLALTYRKPFPIEQPGFFHINLDRQDGRKAFFSAHMEDGDGVVYSEATALFITPKP
ncbi:hypothetical protein AC1031_004318 [Aphanomyces cochlioides]|nr:hypothetical protein AC1031_004318 [Aphanomyces cochlioides]